MNTAGEWFANFTACRDSNERIILTIFTHLGKPKSYLDIGCGDAWMVRAARMLGCKPSIGVEISDACQKLSKKWARVLIGDISKPLVLRNNFDLVTCINVLDILDADSCPCAANNLVKYADRWIVISTNNPVKWKSLVCEQGMLYEDELTDAVRSTLCSCIDADIANRLMVFQVPK